MKIRHAFTGYTYERIDLDRVKVVDPATGREGVFDSKGRWQSGDLTYADFHMCGAVGGRKAADPVGGGLRSQDQPTGEATEGERHGKAEHQSR